MPRKAAKDVPGTERYRDERRKGGGPKMHSREWHDHEQPRDIEPLAESVGNEARVEADTASNVEGTGRRRKSGTSQGRERRKRTVPPSKGVKKPAYGSKRGHRASDRSGGR